MLSNFKAVGSIPEFGGLFANKELRTKISEHIFEIQFPKHMYILKYISPDNLPPLRILFWFFQIVHQGSALLPFDWSRVTKAL